MITDIQIYNAFIRNKKNCFAVNSELIYIAPDHIPGNKYEDLYKVCIEKAAEEKTNENVKSFLALFLGYLDEKVQQATSPEKKYLTEKYLSWISEFPIIIPDQEVWRSLTKNEPKANKYYFRVDYFFPYLNLILELDSKEWHEEKEYLDKKRDEYIKGKFGIDTIRVSLAGLNITEQRRRFESSRNAINKRLTQALKGEIIIPKDMNLDFVISEYREEYKWELEMLGKLESHPGFYNISEITIDQNKLDIGTKTYLGINYYKQRLKNTMKFIFEKDLYFSDEKA